MVGARAAGTSIPFSDEAQVRHHAFQNHVRALHDQRRDERKCRGGRIGRHAHRRGHKLGLPLQRNAAAVLAMRHNRNLGTEMPQHALGVVARRFLFDHDGLPGRVEPGQQHRRLELRGRRRRLIDNGDGVARALQGQRQAAALGRRQRARAHALERIEHAPHRALAQGGVAIESRRHRAGSHRPHHETAAGAGIAEIEVGPRLRESSDTDTHDAPHALALAGHGRLERAHGLGGIEHVLAFEQSGHPGSADCQRTENQRPMRNRLVAGNAHMPLQARGAAGGQRGRR
jgi:hypothetical protein